jgi:hypothetical protein
VSDDLLHRWRLAEATVGDPLAVEAATATLPPRLAALLRALEALDAGRPAEVRALAEATREHHPDIAATLDLLLTPASEVDREALRAVQVSEELPYGLLLDAAHVARTGRPAQDVSPQLEHAAGYRPALHAVFRLLTDDETETFTNPLVHAFSPRADQLQVAARAVQITGHTARTRLAQHFGGLAMQLSPERWPQLNDKAEDGDIEAWARGRPAWTDDHDAEVAQRLAGSPAARRSALGAILHRVGRDAPLGRLAGLARPVRAAFSLGWSLDPDSELIEVLAALQLRVDRFDPDQRSTSPALYVQLWRHAADWPIEERLRAAQAVVDHARTEALPEELLDAVGLLLARGPASAEAGDLLLELVSRRPPQEISDLLARHAAPQLRRVHLMGLHAASSGFLTHGLRAVSLLAAEPSPDAEAIGQILRTFVGAVMRREAWPDELTAAVGTATQALAASTLPLSVWGPLLAHPTLANLAAGHRDHLLGRADLDADDPRELAAALTLLGTWGEEAAQREAVRILGRKLRTMPDQTGSQLALGTLSWIFAWNSAAARTWTAGWLRPVSLFLLREGEVHAERAVRELPVTGPIVAGAVDWYLANSTTPTVSSAWRNRLRSLLSVPEDVADTFAQVTEQTDLTGAHGLAAAAARLQQALDARLQIAGS